MTTSSLTPNARSLFRALFFFEMGMPFVFFFISAFIFRVTQSYTSVLSFNATSFVSIPVFFYVTGLLLRKFYAKQILALGLVGLGIVVLTIFFIPVNPISLLVFGALYGVPIGIFWAARHFLELRIIQDSFRNYYAGLTSSINTLAAILTPLVAGLTIKLGEITALYSPQEAYRVLGIIVLGLFVIGVYLIRGVQLPKQQVKELWFRDPSPIWNWVRLSQIMWGFQNGIEIIFPSLLVFHLVGTEGSLGVIQSIAAMITAVLLFSISKRLSVKRRLHLAMIGAVLLFGAGFFLSISFVYLGAVVYLLVSMLGNKLIWMTQSPLLHRLIEYEEEFHSRHGFTYISDLETMLNVGRLIGVGLFFGLIFFSLELRALQIIPLISGFLVIGKVLSVKRAYGLIAE